MDNVHLAAHSNNDEVSNGMLDGEFNRLHIQFKGVQYASTARVRSVVILNVK